MDESLIASLEAAVARAPQDVPLRLHLGGLLVAAGRGSDAVPHLAVVLQQDPGSDEARQLMAQALGAPVTAGPLTTEPSGSAHNGSSVSRIGMPISNRAGSPRSRDSTITSPRST